MQIEEEVELLIRTPFLKLSKSRKNGNFCDKKWLNICEMRKFNSLREFFFIRL